MRKMISYKVLLTAAILTVSVSYSQVNQQWVRRYATTGFDRPVGMKTDRSGNVYVLGLVNEATNNENFVTIKYNSAGTVQWTQTYNGPANRRDHPSAIVIDALGNVYVAGYSDGGQATSSDVVTIKYNSTGVQEWIATYNGPANLPDEGRAIAIDAAGNVYITGYTSVGVFMFDYITIKYNQAGIQLWTSTYNGTANSTDMANFISVDASGNVYITGESQGRIIKRLGAIATFQDYVTIKYDANGNTIWERRYNGPGNSGDRPYGMAVDAAGNICVTGRSTLNGSTNILTVKYNAIGNLLWAFQYNGPANANDAANGIALDPSGNIYVTGLSDAGFNKYDFVTIKYSPSGVLLWLSRYNGPFNGHDLASAIQLDAFGNVYVTGESQGIGTDYDFATVKYNNSGLQLWVARYNGPANLSDRAAVIAVHTPRNISFNNVSVYVAGPSYGMGTFSDIATIKYTQPLVISPLSSIANSQETAREKAHKVYGFHLSNSPNPFMRSTIIRYEIPFDSHVSIRLYDIVGREIANVVNAKKPAGVHIVPFISGKLPKGIYIYKLVAESPKGRLHESRALQVSE